ncbi:hypothetical protein GVM20_05415 [Porphyrobacter sp. SLTP]|uniref:hypothetical protein n=1 Tax=Porphyrobacter sp. SLTP TaxID=2683266 RepID=UPI0014122857|nr:hypothetical protein [Porphyrobacter sp. SLTP]NBB24556.1 hypothetical protein [Porphyrobacter sp. SLTP]
MIPLRRFLLACAGSLLLLPFAAAAQSDEQASETPPAAETPAPKPDSEPAKDNSAEEGTAEENKRVCKSVRADPSSRRKTRVCRTMEEWRGLNVPT